ncbi:MAG: peptide ABC transporter substrate-binding protein [Chloroflexota bacterium]|nr:peptide ABC transporter substrate-binding protein [Chloroflexota bacterium]
MHVRPPLRRALGALLVVLAVVAVAIVASTDRQAVGQQTGVQLRVLGSAPATWDPAQAGDAGSVSVLAQVFEGLTAFDHENRVQPALAESWTVGGDGRSIDFKLRPGISYSDGSPIDAQHVVDSWLRLIDPARPAPLASLLADVAGANAYLRGEGTREAVALRAEGDRVLVELARPATYFLAVTASPPLAVVPPEMHGSFAGPDLPAAMIVSGGYRPTRQDLSTILLEGNANYWAGAPPLSTIEVVTDTAGRSRVDMFEEGAVDYTDVSSSDAAWLRYDRALGPQLRSTPDLTIHYYGFDTTTPPFDDVRVRRAFAQAVNWDRIVRLGGDRPARSMVPPGIPGGGSEDYRPPYDPEAARTLLAEAGFPKGEGFPAVALVSNGYGYEEAVVTELERELGVSVSVELMDYSAYLGRGSTPDAPRFWTLTWSADYPHAHDFLGLLLETGSVNNEGRWSNARYDAAIEQAAGTADPDEQERHYAEAQEILRAEVPIVPVEALEGWALAREGLLGALQSGVGYVRFAGMAWAEGSGR